MLPPTPEPPKDMTMASSIAAPATRRGFSVLVGLVALMAAFVVFFWSARGFDAGRPDFFYLADAFLHGRTWLDRAFRPYDVVVVGARVYVPFAPFPAFVLAPLVALVGPMSASSWEPVINSLLAVTGLALLWRLSGRLGVASLTDRVWLLALFGFSTATWWATLRGGVWHTGQLLASILTFLGLLEAFGRRRPLVMGLLAGAGFGSRATLLAALPYWGWRSLLGSVREHLPSGLADVAGYTVRRAALLVTGVAPALLFAVWYNAVRFGNPLESGYGLAAIPPFLEVSRELGVFSLAHLGMNLDYFLWHLGQPIPDFPWFKPDGLGMSVFLTSPGLLLAVRADWRNRETVALALTALLVLVPSLLYYGGGWVQLGYRYALDSFPFVMALCAMAAARRGIGRWWKVLIVVGVVVNLYGVYWTYNP
ncbi:MAG: hypothetical protein ACHQ01_03570 [Candidatus Limnocylindrales bacterium]